MKDNARFITQWQTDLKIVNEIIYQQFIGKMQELFS